MCTQNEKASLVTFNQSVFWCSPQIFESAKWKTNCDLLVVTLSAGSAASFLHLHLLVFISRFVGRRGVRKGEKKNHLKCIFPRTIFLGYFSGDSHLYFILYPHSYLESFLQRPILNVDTRISACATVCNISPLRYVVSRCHTTNLCFGD